MRLTTEWCCLVALVVFFNATIPHLTLGKPLVHSQEYNDGSLGPCPNQTFVSNDLTAPLLNVVYWSEECADGGSYLLAPRCKLDNAISGPVIYDEKGDLVWKGVGYSSVHFLNVQQYQGQNYLVFWAGNTTNRNGHGDGYFHMLDESYSVVHNVSAAGGLPCDFHEFRITPRGSVLIAIFDPTPADLFPGGGPENGVIFDAVFQEIDLADNSLIFEWRASEHLDPNESQMPGRSTSGNSSHPYDAYHINSVDFDDTGNYLVSFRHLDTIAYISGDDGTVLWRLGGLHNDFNPGLSWSEESNEVARINFHWQHNVQWDPSKQDTILLFNNFQSQYSRPHIGRFSHGLQIGLNLQEVTAELMGNFSDTAEAYLSVAEGSIQRLEDQDVFIGYGSAPAFAQFSANGDLQCEMQFGSRSGFQSREQSTYRVYKDSWVGRPNTRPDLVVEDGVAYVSWNGATEIATWAVAQLLSNGEGEVWITEAIAKEGFETVFPLSVTARAVKIIAQGKDGTPLGETREIELGIQSPDVPDGSDVGYSNKDSRTVNKLWLLSGNLTGMTVLMLGFVCVYATFRMLLNRSRRVRRYKYRSVRT